MSIKFKTSTTTTMSSFAARQERHLITSGRFNATSASRVALPLEFNNDEDNELDDGKSVAASIASYAPSLHPSLAGSVISKACSESTIGAGDQTGYWDYQHRLVEVKDLGHKCRECKLPFNHLNEPMTERRGARISQRYHAECFSGFADPRSQASSTAHVGVHAGSHFEAAPAVKAGSKMRAASHFNSSSKGTGLPVVVENSAPSKIVMGSNSFGAKSSKGAAQFAEEHVPIESTSTSGGLTAAALAAHNASLSQP